MEDRQTALPAPSSPTPPVAASLPSVPLRVSSLPGVPATLARRRRGHAWVVSLAVHGSVLALALWGLGREVSAPPPSAVRLVFVAPPPPPPRGVPDGIGSAPVAEVPAQPRKKPTPPPQPTLKVPKRLVVPQRMVKLKDLQPEPPAAVAPRAAVTPEAPQAGDATGVDGGVTGGVPGGVVGGTRGGVVGGTITAPVRLDQVAHPPVALSRVEPDYPEMARLRGIEGRVVLEAIVDRDGRIEPEIKILKSVSLLDTAAVDALKQWRFTPGRDARGVPVRVILEVPIRFVLE